MHPSRAWSADSRRAARRSGVSHRRGLRDRRAACAIGDDTLPVSRAWCVYPDCAIGARVHPAFRRGDRRRRLRHRAATTAAGSRSRRSARVRIGDDVEIGANTTIDRGALDDTVIEDGVKLDNQIQIGHNVRIGAHTAIAGCVGIAGSADIGRHCTHRRRGDDRRPPQDRRPRARLGRHADLALDPQAGRLHRHLSRSTSMQAWARNAAHVRQLDALRTGCARWRSDRETERMAEMDIQRDPEVPAAALSVPAGRPRAGDASRASASWR